MLVCPECKQEFSSQGLWGHLSMGHGLKGEALENAYRTARQEGERKSASVEQESAPVKQGEGEKSSEEEISRFRSLSSQGRNSGSHLDGESTDETDRVEQDPVERALERYRRCWTRLQALRDARPNGSRFTPARGGHQTWEEKEQECQEALEEAREDLREEMDVKDRRR